MNVRLKLQTHPQAMQNKSNLKERVLGCRSATEKLCEGLEPEDMCVQPIADVSPIKWHLAHTTWFFEELILLPNLPDYQRFDEGYRELFNSYYKSLGRHWVQGDRGSLSRPTVREINLFRIHVNRGLFKLLTEHLHSLPRDVMDLIELGIQHEQQHQELILMDIKYILSRNPSLPAFRDAALGSSATPTKNWIPFPEKIYEVGTSEEHSFAFDNEKPRHKRYVYPFAVQSSVVSNQDFLRFIDDGGYERPEFWLSMGWDWVQANAIRHPLYWARSNDTWSEYTLQGSIDLEPNFSLTHVSYYEADAFARWSGCRLPREEELEIFLAQAGETSSATKDVPSFHPTNVNAVDGQVWCWTQSHYSPYPGFKEFRGPTREYNGKFMCSQFVLRGACVATPKDHYRSTYRNFFLPGQRWMFSGIRLAKDLA